MEALHNLKELIKESNPLEKRRLAAMRKELTNREFSLFASNCLGGILLHDLGLQFLSPTVNLQMTQTDFVRLVTHMDDYLNGDFTFFDYPGETCPCAYLGGKNMEITVHFTHYKTPEESVSKWRERTARINYDNLFIVCSERDGLTKEEIESLGHLNVRGILVFTAREYPDIPYTLYLPQYAEDGEVGNVLRKKHLDGRREYEERFNWVKWFNTANGGNYDIAPYLIG